VSGLFESTFHLPRHSFSPRDVARPGSLWRACQDAAVDASVAGGWPPERYRVAETAFVVREMTVLHHRESTYGEPLTARTWVSRLRRQLLSTREVRISSAAGPIASATQEWVHVSAELKPLRASPEMVDAFPTREDLGGSVTMPVFEAIEGAPVHRSTLRPWHTWMDPLNHVNHPMYVDFADEALARVAVAAGIPEYSVKSVAEMATFRVGVSADAEVEVQSQLTGTTEAGAVAVSHRIVGKAADGAGDILYAQVVTVRTLSEAAPRLRESLMRTESH